MLLFLPLVEGGVRATKEMACRQIRQGCIISLVSFSPGFGGVQLHGVQAVDLADLLRGVLDSGGAHYPELLQVVEELFPADLKRPLESRVRRVSQVIEPHGVLQPLLLLAVAERREAPEELLRVDRFVAVHIADREQPVDRVGVAHLHPIEELSPARQGHLAAGGERIEDRLQGLDLIFVEEATAARPGGVLEKKGSVLGRRMAVF